jgi:hypothetical protein
MSFYGACKGIFAFGMLIGAFAFRNATINQLHAMDPRKGKRLATLPCALVAFSSLLAEAGTLTGNLT